MELERIIALGKDIGLEGDDLRQFVKEQEKTARDERAAERDERAADRENRKIALENEMKQKELDQAVELARIQTEAQIQMEQLKHQSGSESNPRPIMEKVKLPKLPVFDEKTDNIDAFLQRFERFATCAEWPNELWAISLASLLQGKALDIYHQLPETESTDYLKVKEALFREYECTAEGFRSKFRNIRFQKSETAKQLAARLKKLLERWMEMANCNKDFNDFEDLILREQFFNACDYNLRMFLNERKLESLVEVVETADRYIEAHGLPYRKKFVPRVNQKDLHSEKQEPANTPNTEKPMRRECFLCHKTGHLAKDCWSRNTTKVFTKKAQVASAVNSKEGDSANPKKSENAAAVVRVNPKELVNKEGWIVKDGKGFPVVCGGVQPSEKSRLRTATGFVEGKSVTVMRDPGCTTVLVKRNLVDPSKYTGKMMNIVLANSELHSYPEAIIDIDTPYFKGKVTAACLENPLFDVIIGEIPGVMEMNDCAAVTRNLRSTDKKLPKLKVSQLSSLLQNKKIADFQKEDESLAKVWTHAEDGTVFTRSKSGEESQYIVMKGILYRRVKVRDNQIDQLIVPSVYRADVLELAHAGLMGGHLGIGKTRDRIFAKFFWPGATQEIARYCKSCDICQRTVDKGRIPKAKLGQMPVITEPFSRVAVDLIGPIEPRSSNGAKYILTIVDFATRYPEAVALTKIDSETVAEALLEVFSRTGIPKEILSDKGTQFTSEMIKEFYRLLSIRMINTTPYHAMCNGLVEKFNGTLKKMLKRMCAEQPKEWHRYLAPLLFAYRDVPQKSTKYSPFELVYGHTVRGPLSLLKELWEDDGLENETRTAYEYVLDLRNRLQETCTLASQELKQSQESAQNYYDRKAKDRKLKVGTDVLLLLPTNNNKLLLQWKGPFKVIKVCNKHNYEIDVNGSPRRFHINMLKEYIHRNPAVMKSVAAVAVLDFQQEDGLLVVPNTEQGETWQDVVLDDALTPQMMEDVRQILSNHEATFTDVPGRTHLTECSMTVVSDEVININPYPIPYNLHQAVKEELDCLRKLKIIEPSESPFSSPLCVSPKKDGKIRLCLDLRQINKIMRFDAEPMCDSNAIFSRISKSKFFSKIDLTKGYYQIPLSQESKKYTSFSTPEGLCQYTVLPFGYVNAPAVFNRFMRQLFKDVQNVEVFLDDILIHAVTWEEHCEILNKVLDILKYANLTAKPSKCEVGKQSIEYLGHIIGNGNIKPTSEKVESVQKARIPTTKKEVRSFLGLSGYYRMFIPNYTNIVLPLIELTRKKAPNKVVWETRHQESFDLIKNALTNGKVLKLVDFTNPFTLRTDASESALGAVLLQEHEGKEWPVAYASRKLSPAERKYAVVEREGLAVVWATKKFYQYLYGREFVLETDHQPLRYLQSAKLLNGRLMRWAIHLQQFKISIRYVKGSENVGADYLSRSC